MDLLILNHRIRWTYLLKHRQCQKTTVLPHKEGTDQNMFPVVTGSQWVGRRKKLSHACLVLLPNFASDETYTTPEQGQLKGWRSQDLHIPSSISLHMKGKSRSGKCASESINHVSIPVQQNELDFAIMKFILSNRTLHPYP